MWVGQFTESPVRSDCRFILGGHPMGATAFSIITLNIMTLSILTFSIIMNKM
jgi:hypothetical protein